MTDPKKQKMCMLMYLIIFFTMHTFASAGTISGVSNVVISPPSPSPGQQVTVTWQFTDSAISDPRIIIAASTQCQFQKWGTAGQDILVGDGCTLDTDTVGGGCALTGTVTGVNTASQVVTIPSTLTPGFTYYIIVGTREYNIYINNPGEPALSQQSCVSFSIPLPPPYINLRKVAEGSAANAAGKVLYTIFYDIANTNGAVITDAVPSDMTFVEAYDGGTYSAGTVTWNLGNFTSPVKGSVSFLVTVNGGVTAGQVIHNTASGTSSGASGVSNDAPVTIGASLKISKFGNPNTVAVGQNMTFTFTYTNEGYALDNYTDFDIPGDITGWTYPAAGATWNVTGGKLVGTGPASQWGKIVKPSPALHNAMYITDVYVPSSNSTGDAAFIFNFIDAGNMYHARIQTDASPSQLCFDKVVGGPANWTSVQCVSVPGMLNNSWQTIKVQVNGSNIKIKAWPKAGTEPPNWQINLTDTSLPGTGTAGYQDNEGEDWFDNLKVFVPAPATHLRVWDTLPACITYVGCNQGCTYSGGVVSWDFPGVQGNTVNSVSFWASADLCANNSTVSNTGCMDSDEPAPSVCSDIATVVVGALDSPTFTATRTSTPTPTQSYTSTPTRTYTPTLSHTASPTAPGTFTNTPTITPTPTASNTATDTLTFTPTMTYSATYTVTPTRTPAPAEIQLTFTAVDPATSVGGYAQFRLTVRNAGTAVTNITLSEAIPADVTFEENPSDAGGNTGWAYAPGTITRVLSPADIALLNSGSTLTFYFTVKTLDTLSSGDVINFSPVDALYDDQIFTGAHAYSLPAFITVGDIVVYPNPFNPSTAIGNKLKFANLPRDTQITIFTLNSEQVVAFNAQSAYVYWDGKNAYGKEVAPGIYYYILKYNEGKTRLVGKIFVVKQ